MAGNTAPGASPSAPAGPEFGHPLLRILQEFTLEANRYVDAAGDRKDMHRTDMNALAVIMRHTARGNVVTPGLLRKELNLSSPATTALIDRLDSAGHVVRERHSTDRRQVQLKMTPKAFREGGAIFAPLAKHMGSALAGFSESELDTVTRFMTAMIEATIAARTETAPE
ncbi:MarR family winged helix-turn-helix transcriptional regulator [Pseudarthrobacter niigatensis]|uniref:DNA-binding MarR family transcriptional regulator n=1 Tax=Pseudarthrobacter niigatensis TaxID=369935 RepID=A0AAJ1ST59_9MICC|nr:MarR family winged helix-turn-helix transcriptional regulator [Pseudarthrobacter niigatensis]MDQ0145283.1 DNA-binding MarR family transcriptional regulator [Pseudarthrobacter niigatensis]MDQ0265943.1 DNA-binding MarR family transcriptional regulator [Pseudarthrobacter niigatensis]